MSYCQLSEKDRQVAAERKEGLRDSLRRKLFKSILPELLLQDDMGAILDTTLGIDRKTILAEALREVANLVDGGYTLEDIKGGYCE